MDKKTAKNVNAELADILSQDVVSQAANSPVFAPEENTESAELAPEQPKPEPVVHFVTEDQPGYEPQAEPQSLSPDDMAIIGVNMLDGIQRFGFAWLRKKAVFTPEELELLGTLDPTGNTVYSPAGGTEDIAAKKYKKHLEVISALPFTDPEKQRLTDATKIYLRTTQVKVSPFTGLLLAYSEVLGMRAITVFDETL